MNSTIAVRVFLFASLTGTLAAETVLLQNGRDGYSGCTDSYVYKRHASSPIGDEVAQGGNDLLVEEDQA